jgi:hypothetical protein
MASVSSYEECPNCKEQLYAEFNYKNGEEYSFCTTCGYKHNFYIERDENGEYVTKDGTDDRNFGNLVYKTETLKNPFGAYTIKTYKSNYSSIGSLKDEEAYNLFKDEISFDPEVEYCTVSRYIENDMHPIQVETIVDKTVSV